MCFMCSAELRLWKATYSGVLVHPDMDFFLWGWLDKHLVPLTRCVTADDTTTITHCYTTKGH